MEQNTTIEYLLKMLPASPAHQTSSDRCWLMTRMVRVVFMLFVAAVAESYVPHMKY